MRTRIDFATLSASLSDAEFRRIYRMGKPSFEKLVERLEPRLLVDDRMATISSRGPISTSVRLAAALRFFAGASYLDIYPTYGMSRTSFYEIVHSVVDAINEEFQVSFPMTNRNELEEMADEHDSYLAHGNPLKGCVGAIDGLCVRIKRPGKDVPNAASFWNRKGFYSFNVQGVTDAKYRFRFVSIKRTGATHDSLAYAVTGFHRELPSLLEPFWIAGDEAYPCGDKLLTPWSGRNLPSDKDSFNYWLSAHRCHVEQSFGMLVQRWGLLWRKIDISTDRVSKTVMAIVKMQNFCLDEKERELASIVTEKEQEMRMYFGKLSTEDDTGRRRDLEQSNKRVNLTASLNDNGVRRPSRPCN